MGGMSMSMSTGHGELRLGAARLDVLAFVLEKEPGRSVVERDGHHRLVRHQYQLRQGGSRRTGSRDSQTRVRTRICETSD